MMEFLAKTDKQLGLCLRMLFAEQIPFDVRLELTDKGKIVYHVEATADDEKLSELKLRYTNLVG